MVLNWSSPGHNLYIDASILKYIGTIVHIKHLFHNFYLKSQNSVNAMKTYKCRKQIFSLCLTFRRVDLLYIFSFVIINKITCILGKDKGFP